MCVCLGDSIKRFLLFRIFTPPPPLKPFPIWAPLLVASGVTLRCDYNHQKFKVQKGGKNKKGWMDGLADWSLMLGQQVILTMGHH